MNRDLMVLDRCWEYLVFALVGEMLDEKDEVCGAGEVSHVLGDHHVSFRFFLG
jgi:hypothetical protein